MTKIQKKVRVKLSAAVCSNRTQFWRHTQFQQQQRHWVQWQCVCVCSLCFSLNSGSFCLSRIVTVPAELRRGRSTSAPVDQTIETGRSPHPRNPLYTFASAAGASSLTHYTAHQLVHFSLALQLRVCTLIIL